MNRRKLVFGSILSLGLLTGGVLFTQAQAGRHARLDEAYQLVGQAFDKIVEAQRANEWDMGGHAARAKDLLQQANREIKLAADAANRH